MQCEGGGSDVNGDGERESDVTGKVRSSDGSDGQEENQETAHAGDDWLLLMAISCSLIFYPVPPPNLSANLSIQASHYRFQVIPPHLQAAGLQVLKTN